MWPKKIIARIEGGLGNQLFQYAAARSLADRLGLELALDLRGLVENGDRPFALDLYRIRACIATSSELSGLPHWRPTRVGRMRSRISQRFPSYFSFPLFWPSSFSYDYRIERVRKPVYMVGYWQSEKYFKWNRMRVLEDVQLRNPLSVNGPMLDMIHRCTSVALHVRRGDYVTNPVAAQFHGLCDMRYYQRAVDEMKVKLKNFTIFVFSDDSEWSRKNLKFDVPTYIVEGEPVERSSVDLELMSQCQHHIIANSSFSWWGAWRRKSPQQHVYAPSRWFLDLKTNTSDVIPSNWRTLD